jgi:hypothetical protein
MESKNLISEQGDFDNYWIKNRNGYQLLDIKYPNFNDVQIDNELRHEITYNSLKEDITSTLELLDHLEKSLVIFFNSERKSEIDKFFRKFNYSQINFLLYSYLLRRKITLIYYMLSYKLEGKNEFIEKTIDENFISMTCEKLRDFFFSFYDKLPFKKDDKFVSDSTQIIQNNMDHEKIIYLSHNIPSLSSIGVCIMFLKSIINESLDYFQSLIKYYNDETMINFLYAVNAYLI